MTAFATLAAAYGASINGPNTDTVYMDFDVVGAVMIETGPHRIDVEVYDTTTDAVLAEAVAVDAEQAVRIARTMAAPYVDGTVGPMRARLLNEARQAVAA